MNKAFLGVLFLASAQAFASVPSVSIRSFTVVRQGGGQLEAVVSFNKAREVGVHTVSCGFRTLAAKDQQATAFTLKGDDAIEAAAILENKATLASDQSISNPTMATGTWGSLEVNYTYLDGRFMRSEKKEIKAPLVVIDFKVSDVLSRIETEAREANKAVCK